MKNMLASIVKNKIVSCIVLLGLGFLLLIAPGGTSELVVRLVGAVLLAGAVVAVLIYLMSKSNERSPLVLFEGIVVAAVALFFLIAPGVVTGILPLIFGIILLLNALLDLITALRLPQGKGVAVVLSLLAVIAAVLIICNPNALANFITRLIGIVLIYNGLVGVFGLLIFYFSLYYKPFLLLNRIMMDISGYSSESPIKASDEVTRGDKLT